MDFRVFVSISCTWCDKPVTWLVYEDRYTPDYVPTCDNHKTTAYS